MDFGESTSKKKKPVTPEEDLLYGSTVYLLSINVHPADIEGDARLVLEPVQCVVDVVKVSANVDVVAAVDRRHGP